MKGFGALAVFIVVAYAFALLVGGVLNVLPGFEYVDGKQAFVYPTETGEVALVLASGEYLVEGTSIQTGCYKLEQPEYGQIRGRAHWIWPLCGEAK
jgi:hypothetical protein